jgi:Fe-Mn family superoxide dismutase
MAFELPPLPWAEDALEPVTSARTIGFHYGKHHRAYVDNLNKLVAGTDLEGRSLEEVIGAVAGDPAKAGVFNNAAQVWNHTFYWNSMKPGGGGEPTGEVADAVNSAFGSLEGFTTKFAEAATTQFGSGWAWLIQGDAGLEITKTANADLPLKHGQKALLTIDVWEHAYYIDYRNARPNYIKTFTESLLNWDFVAANMA